MVMGTHLLVNLFGCPEEKLEKADVVLDLLNQIVKKAHLNKVGESSYQFKPLGATAVILLRESHISIHTWPEKSSAAVDIFTCSNSQKNQKAFDELIKLFQPTKYEKHFVER